jgi:hypothetical protein
VTRFWGFLFCSIRLVPLAATLFLLAFAGFAELFPFVEDARSVVPASVYKGNSACGCDCISGSRPWYGTFNYWGWLLVFLTPAIILHSSPRSHWAIRTLIGFLAMESSHIILVLADRLVSDIRNAPFARLPFELSVALNDCVDVRDTPVVAILYGWIPAFLYVLFWSLCRALLLKGMYIYRRKTV